MPNIELTFSKADLIGTCNLCDQPATGSFDHDEDRKDPVEGDEDGATEWHCELKCVNCGNKMPIKIEEPMIEAYNDPLWNSKVHPLG